LNGSYPIATCTDTSDCAALSSALIPNYLGTIPSDPSSTSSYSYTSDDGTDFTVAATLADTTGYSYTASIGFGTTGGGSGSVTWLSDYSKRKTITVTSSSSLSNYQILLTVAYDSDMQADFDDLRFTSDDETTLIDYWIESKTDSSTAKVWVEVPTLASGDTTIYMYYGNPSAATASNGVNTFIVFDDFNDGSINTSLWQDRSGAGWSISESGGELNTVADGNHGWGAVRTVNEFTKGNYRFVTNARYQNPGAYGPRTEQNVYDKALVTFEATTYGTPTKNAVYYIMHGHWSSQPDAQSFSMGKIGNTGTSSSSMSSAGQFVVGNMIRMDGKFNLMGNTATTDFYVNGVYKDSRSVSFSDVLMNNVTFELHGWYYGSGSNSHWDYAFVGNYSPAEPSSSFGEEESN
jgi:hypothetical protein